MTAESDLLSAPTEKPQPGQSLATPARPKRRRAKWRRWVALLVILLLGGSGYYVFRPSTGSEGQQATVEVQKGDIEETVTALGSLQPRDYVDVGAQVSGQLDKIHVEVGDLVTQGQLLAEIDARVQLSRVEADRAELAALQAQLAERQAQLELAQLQYQRQQRLMRDNATSEEALQSARATDKTTRAQIEALKAQIQQAESTLKGNETTFSYTKIYAPMAGTVVSLSARQGQTLNTNQQAPVILQIADLSTMTVKTQVSEADVPKLRLGMPAYFSTLGMPNRRWQGTLRQVQPTPEVTNNVVLYTALFDVANPEGTLLPQMTAQVSFVQADAKDVVKAPLASLRPRNEAKGLYQARVLGADGQVQEREVRIGVRNRSFGEVLSGLQPGDRLLSPSRGAGKDSRQTEKPRLRGF